MDSQYLKYLIAKIVTLTATPPAGKTFVGWSGGCTGSGLICSFTANADTSVKASFSK